jgi:hypothetical protein
MKDKVTIKKNGGYYGEVRRGFIFKKTVAVPLKIKEELDLFIDSQQRLTCYN